MAQKKTTDERLDALEGTTRVLLTLALTNYGAAIVRLDPGVARRLASEVVAATTDLPQDVVVLLDRYRTRAASSAGVVMTPEMEATR